MEAMMSVGEGADGVMREGGGVDHWGSVHHGGSVHHRGGVVAGGLVDDSVETGMRIG